MYGKSFHVDLGECDISLFNRHDIDRFFRGVGEIMEVDLENRYFWDDENTLEEDKQTDPKKMGISAVQFLLASNITIHTLPLRREAYIDIFSCDLFDITEVYDYCIKFFDAHKSTATPLSRGRF